MGVTTVTLPSLNPEATRKERQARDAFRAGYAYQQRREWENAIACYNRSIRLCPADAFAALSNRAMCHYQICKPELALKDYEAAHKIGGPQLNHLTRVNRGVLLGNVRRYDEALADFYSDSSPDAKLNAAYIHLMRGEYDRGFALYAHRPTALQWKNSVKSLDALADKHVLVIHEQGYGDSIQMARFVPRIATIAKSVRWATRTALAPFLADNLRNIEVIDCGETKAAALAYKADAHILVMDLWQACRDFDGKPYLKAKDPPPLPPGRKIGLAWRGRTAFANDHNRSTTLQRFTPQVDAMLVSMQVDLTEAERATGIFDGGKMIKNFADSAAVISCLDAVISVDTAAAHLAGALGVPCALCLPYAADWRWGESGETTPWYDSIRIFRQPQFGAWEPVIAAASQWLSR